MADKVRFAVDEDIDERIIRGVLRRDDDVDFVSVKDVGLRGVADEYVLEWSAREGRVLISHDRNSMCGEAIERIDQKLRMPGLIIIPQEQNFGSYIDQIIEVFTYGSPEEWNDRIEYFH